MKTFTSIKKTLFIPVALLGAHLVNGQASISPSGYTQNFDNLNVAVWTFPSSGTTTTPVQANSNNTTKALTIQGGAGAITDIAGASTRAASANNWTGGNNTKFWQIEINTTGYTGLTLSSKQRSSSAGPEDFRVQYRIGTGGSWTNAGADITVADNWTTGALSNLNLPAACNNQASLFIRWVMRGSDAVSGSVTNAGTSSIDDILITSSNLGVLTGWNFYAISGNNSSWGTVIPLSGNPSAASTSGLNNTLIVNNMAETKEYSSSTAAYNLANSGNPGNRSVGTSPTNMAAGIFQLGLINNSGAARSTMNIQYQIRRFTTPSYFDEISLDDRLPGYQLFYSLDNGSNWTNVTALNPTISNMPNSVGVTNIGCATISFAPATLGIGQEIRFRWIDDNSNLSSPDQVIGLDSININFATCASLPVRLTQFNATLNQSVANINWLTEAESEFSHFEIERSSDGGKNFRNIRSVNAAGDNGGRGQYQYADNLKHESGNSFAYRLKMVDKNQTFSYSNIVVVRRSAVGLNKLTIAPNPVIGKTATLQFNSADNSDIQIRIFDLTGRIMLQQQNRVNTGMNSIGLQNLERLQTGQYIIQVAKDKEINTLKFSVN